MTFKLIANFLSRIFYGWRMIGLVSAIRVVGGGLHPFGFTVFFFSLSQDLRIWRGGNVTGVCALARAGRHRSAARRLSHRSLRPTADPRNGGFSCRRRLHPALLGE